MVFVRPCTATAAAPACSSAAASAGALHEPLSQPRRILTVTGTATAPQTASTIRAARSGSFISALPSPLLTIFGIGQPILISMKSAPDSSSAIAAPSAITDGSLPKICAPQMPIGVLCSRLWLFLSWYTSAREETISVTVTAAPSSAQIVRKARSVTPAIGARTSSP